MPALDAGCIGWVLVWGPTQTANLVPKNWLTCFIKVSHYVSTLVS